MAYRSPQKASDGAISDVAPAFTARSWTASVSGTYRCRRTVLPPSRLGEETSSSSKSSTTRIRPPNISSSQCMTRPSGAWLRTSSSAAKTAL